MKKLVLVLLPLMLLSLLSRSMGQEAFKFGVVDTQRVLINYSEAVKVDNLLKTAEKRWQEELAAIGSEITTLQEKKEKTELFVEKAQTASIERDIQLKQQQYQQKFNQGRDALLEKNRELMTPIIKELEELIKKIGKEENYDLIIDKQAVFYMNEKYDLTDKLIGLINDGAKKDDSKTNNQDAANKSDDTKTPQ